MHLAESQIERLGAGWSRIRKSCDLPAGVRLLFVRPAAFEAQQGWVAPDSQGSFGGRVAFAGAKEAIRLRFRLRFRCAGSGAENAPTGVKRHKAEASSWRRRGEGYAQLHDRGN